MLRAPGGSERGSVAITVVLAMTVLLGFAALVVDVGLNWAARTSAQTAADAAALAGASRLLEDGPAAAILEVQDLLTDNLPELTLPAGWATDTDVGNGEVVCWTLPGDPPAPGADCPEGSNALQVITPPIQVHYAFAPVLGKSANSIKATAAAAAGVAAPNNCVLCLLEPTGPRGLQVLGDGGVNVTGGGIVVNSTNPLALVLSGAGDVRANQIRVVGGIADSVGGGQLLPPAETGGPPVPDPLEGLPTPDELPTPPVVRDTNPQTIITDTTLQPGIYNTVTVQGTATLTLQAGVYVFTGLNGLTVEDTARVDNLGDGVTIYLACNAYPAPCSGPGAQFRVQDDGQFLADPPTVGDYAGLSIFVARGNTRSLRLRSTQDLDLAGALYGPSTPVRLQSTGDLSVSSLLVVDSLSLPSLHLGVLGDDPSVRVSYNPSLPIPGLGVPVLIR
jgi:hypothetical protein